ncbi:hypothetical protein TNCV_3610211 [Trichonephila clavipes]|nr:hypothetical protein TNCV_3610211 [Trichonephila clavipes]
MADPQTVIEGTLKYRDNKKWKPRWCVIRKLSPVAALFPKCLQERFFFKAGNRRKSLGSRLDLYGGWCKCSQPRATIWFCVVVANCGLALSSNNKTPDLRSQSHFFQIATFEIQC